MKKKSDSRRTMIIFKTEKGGEVCSVKAYKSQFYDPNSKEPTTPISSKAFLDSISFRASDLGRMIGVKYAEGFTVERYMGVNSLFDLK